MSVAKHTPGEWKTRVETFKSAREVLDDAERLLWAGGAHNFKITYVVAPDVLPTPPPPWSDGTTVVAYLGNGPTAALNAALIAAAPDLLAACEAAREFLGNVDSNPREHGPAVLLVEAAIAKAKGEQR